MSSGTLPVVDRSYELTKWFLNHLAKFERSHRYGLGKRIEERLFSVLEGLILARYSRGSDKGKTLEQVNLDLEILRMETRLAHELKQLANGSHEYAVREMTEIGRMVGGWLRQLKTVNRSSTV